HPHGRAGARRRARCRRRRRSRARVVLRAPSPGTVASPFAPAKEPTGNCSLTPRPVRGQVSPMKRALLAVVLLLVVGGGAAGYWQSQLIVNAGLWYLGRIAGRENASGTLDERRRILAQMNRYLLMPPARAPQVPELFDLGAQLSSRVATGEV